MSTLYLHSKCENSRTLMEELRRTNNDSYKIVVIDRLRRNMLPPVVTGVPMVVQHDGRVIAGDDLFDQVFRKPASEPGPVYGDAPGALLDDDDAASVNPAGFMDQFFVCKDTVPQDAPAEKSGVSLDEYESRRNSNVEDILGSQARPL